MVRAEKAVLLPSQACIVTPALTGIKLTDTASSYSEKKKLRKFYAKKTLFLGLKRRVW